MPFPNSLVAAVPPSSSTHPLPQTSSPLPNPSNSPPPSTAVPPQANFTPPEPPTLPPLQQSSPPPNLLSGPPPELSSPAPVPPGVPPPEFNSTPSPISPPQQAPPPISVTPLPPMSAQPPVSSLPPPNNAPPPVSSPPPPDNAPPPSLRPPPQPSNPTPTSSPAPPTLVAGSPPPPTPSIPPISPPIAPISPPPTPPSTSSPPPSTSPPPPPSSVAPESPPPPQPPNDAPPPPTARPPENSPPPQPPNNSPPQTPNRSPPPPSPNPPQGPPPPPPPRSANPPQTPPSPPFVPPTDPASPPVASRPPPFSPPSSNAPPRSTPPPPTQVTPSPPFVVSPPGSPSRPPPPTNTSSGSEPGSNQSSGSGGIGPAGTAAIAVAVSLLLLVLFGTIACCIWKRKKKSSEPSGGHILPTVVGPSPQSGSRTLKMQASVPNNRSAPSSDIAYSPNDPSGLGNSRLWFTYDELVNATNGFSDQNLLGEGGFGCVHKGRLGDGKEVAVKQLKVGGGQGEREFRSEVEIISRIHHRHLVSLVGYCIADERRLLVYDYLPNDTLYFHLHAEGRPVMNWATRVKIAIGAARGIAYLHEDCHPRIIHRDIKSSNILLDNNFEARVSDFGLAKLAMDANTHITTRVMGTFGYMAPEYASSGKLTEKSDVYSFGVVLLELISGRKPVDISQPLGEESLVEWARPLLSNALEKEEFGGLADPRLDGNYVAAEIFRLIQVAAACVRHSSAKRPAMGQVVRAFDSMATSDLTNGMRVGESEIYNSAQQSEEIRLFQRMAFGSQDYSTDFFSQNSRSTEGNRESSQERFTH